jgi:hypothetical protein
VHRSTRQELPEHTSGGHGVELPIGAEDAGGRWNVDRPLQRELTWFSRHASDLDPPSAEIRADYEAPTRMATGAPKTPGTSKHG